MAVKEPLYCSLAFASASINSFGEYIPCCNIRVDEWNMYKDRNDIALVDMLNQHSPKERVNAGNLRQLRRQLMKGEWPSACQNCKNAEDAGVASMRDIWNKSIPLDTVSMDEFVSNENIHYLDLTFTTKCNSKCMTCNPDLSDFWEEEHNYIWKYPAHKRKRICIDSNTTKKLIEDFPNVKYISFIGGEPTISDEHLELLHLLVANNRSKNIRLNYVTNLTGIDDTLIELWRNFKAVHIGVSIDAYGIVNEYIRYPFKWNKVEANLRRCLELSISSIDKKDSTLFTVGLSCTISIFNSIQSMDLFRFWFDTCKEYKTENDTLAHIAGCFVNRVSFPEYCMPQLLSIEYRQKGIDKGKELLEYIQEHRVNLPNQFVDQGLIDSIKLVMTWLGEPQIVNKGYLEKAKTLISKSDIFRNRTLQDHIPELWDELNILWNKK